MDKNLLTAYHTLAEHFDVEPEHLGGNIDGITVHVPDCAEMVLVTLSEIGSGYEVGVIDPHGDACPWPDVTLANLTATVTEAMGVATGDLTFL